MFQYKKQRYWLNSINGMEWLYSLSLDKKLIKLDATTQAKAHKQVYQIIEASFNGIK